MKFLFLLWITIRGTFDASVWATAAWCILCYFSNVLWLQCFGMFMTIHFVSNMHLVNYINTHTKQNCLIYMRIESVLVGLSIALGLILSPLLTVGAIALLSVLQVWTSLETHWLHTLLFVACVIYIFSRASGQRRMVLLAHAKSVRRAARSPHLLRVIDV
jgi:hypothetical protein